MGAARPEPRFDWFIPIDGDGVRLGTMQAERPPTFDYLREVVQTAEQLRFDSLLVPTRFVNGLFDKGAPLSETWTMATALSAVTSRIRLLIAIRTGFIAPVLLAKMVATLDQTGAIESPYSPALLAARWALSLVCTTLFPTRDARRTLKRWVTTCEAVPISRSGFRPCPVDGRY